MVTSRTDCSTACTLPPPRFVPVVRRTWSAAPSGNSGTRLVAARAAYANGGGSASGMGTTQSSPRLVKSAQSTRSNAMRSSKTRARRPWCPSLSPAGIFFMIL